MNLGTGSIERRRERQRKYQAQFRLNHQDEIRAKFTLVRLRYKVDVFSHYCPSGRIRCARCGEDDLDVLQLDHINGGGAKQIRDLGLHGGLSFYIWLMHHDYPSGYQVLCANCNIKKRVTERECDWHKDKRNVRKNTPRT